MGTGKQWFAVHIEDVAGIFLHALDNEDVAGILNAVFLIHCGWMNCVSPGVMHRPSLFNAPLFLIFGEAVAVLLQGAKVIPKTIEYGYKFRFETQKALKSFEIKTYSYQLIATHSILNKTVVNLNNFHRPIACLESKLTATVPMVLREEGDGVIEIILITVGDDNITIIFFQSPDFHFNNGI